MSIEQQSLSGTTLTVYLRNATSTGATLDAEYKNGALIASAIGTAINPDAVTSITLSGTYAVGDEITLVTEEGTQIKFKVK